MNLPDMFYALTLALREQCAFMYKLVGLSVCVKVCACMLWSSVGFYVQLSTIARFFNVTSGFEFSLAEPNL